jgi:sRNA-binding regulator protein Hfq
VSYFDSGLILEERGITTQPIDVSEEAVVVMRKRGLKNALNSNFLNVKPESKYDTLLFLMNGIGLVGTISRLSVYLQKAKSLLKQNGQIILDSSSLDEYKYPPDGGAVSVQYQLEYQGKIGKPYQWLYLNYECLYQEALKCGLVAQLIYEEEDGSYLARLVRKD